MSRKQKTLSTVIYGLGILLLSEHPSLADWSCNAGGGVTCSQTSAGGLSCNDNGNILSGQAAANAAAACNAPAAASGPAASNAPTTDPNAPTTTPTTASTSPTSATSANGSDGSTGTSSNVAAFNSAMEESNNPVAADVQNKGATDTVNQTNALTDAQQLNQLGANQAATVGALYCAQGANSQLTNTYDAQAFYASCQQNFSAAKTMNPSGLFSPSSSTLDGPVAQQALSDFDKNFGVSPADYMSRMLGPNGGTGALTDLVGEKIPGEKLADALAAAGQSGASDLTKDPNRFALNLAGGLRGPASAKGVPPSLRDLLKKKLADGDADQEPVSELDAKTHPEKYDHLTPLNDGLFASQDAKAADDAGPGLTLFDVVHLRYAEIRKRWRR